MRPKKALTKFLSASLQTRMRLTALQVGFLEQNLSKEKILQRIEDAEWEVFKEEEQNGVTIYFLIDPLFICSCGHKPSHFHNKKPCCGRQYCCPENEPPEPPDYELLIAQNVAHIREALEKREGAATKCSTTAF